MTKDEILKMPAGREMDALVMEKVLLKCFHRWKAYNINIPEYECLKCGEWIHSPKIEPQNPSYSTSISAAWEVVEKLMEGLNAGAAKQLNWHKFIKYLPDKKFLFSQQAHHTATDICRAALLTTMEER